MERPLRIESDHWPAVLAVARNEVVDQAELAYLVRFGILSESLEITDSAATVLQGVGSARASLSLRVVGRSGSTDIDLFLAPGSTTAVEQDGPVLLLRWIEASLVPVRVAEYLSLGPRGFPRVSGDLATKSLLVPSIISGNHLGAVAAVNELVDFFHRTCPGAATAITEGRWRVSLVQASSDDQPVAAVLLLDTAAGIFALGRGEAEDDLAMVPITTADLWRTLSGLLSLD